MKSATHTTFNFANFAIFLLVLASLFVSINLFAQPNNDLNTDLPIAKMVEAQKQIINFESMGLFEQDIVQNESSTQRAIIEEHITDALFLQIKQNDLAQLLQARKQAIELQIPSDLGMIELELVQNKVVSDDFVLTTETDKGKEIIDYTDGIHYRGIVKGNNNSMATLSIFENEVIGSIHLDGEELVLSRLFDSDKQFDIDYILYRPINLNNPPSAGCGTDDVIFNQFPGIGNMGNAPTGGATDPNRCVRMYFETDYQMYIDRGYNANSVANYVTAVYNQVNTIFFNESINTTISQINVWTTQDPYPSNSSYAALLAFKANLGGNYNGDLAHLLSTKPTGNGGIAYVDVLCNNNWGYAYSNISNVYSNFPNFSWTVLVITHEIGHNLGSPHTHDCSWPGGAIDGCGPASGYSEGCNGPIPNAGTIMSYCHLPPNPSIDLSLGFGPLPGNLIRNRVYNAPCLTACGSVCPTNMNINGFLFASNQKYEVHQNITSTQRVWPAAQNIIYDGGNEINLLPNFHAREGCDFIALIEGCGGSYKTDFDHWKSDDIDLESRFDVSNYPNPFSHTTTIEFTLTKKEIVQISVFDVNGKEIKRLIDDIQYSSGTHTIDFDGSQLENGMYFYTVQTQDNSQTNKLMILR